MVVDDDAGFGSSVCAVLESAGYRARYSTCAREATAILDAAESRPDLVIADAYLPGEHPLHFLRAIRDRPSVPTIVVTGRPTVDVAVSAFRGRAVDFLTKPVDPEQLIAAVERATGESGSHRGPDLSTLSTRELQVLDSILAGRSIAETSKQLFISPHTVKNHLKAIHRKLDVSTRVELLSLFVDRASPRHRPGS
ncbi:MAG: response regulator [Planctomycetes bacterium]|nr:response regulator [Planctomycetota bacterium]